MAILDERGARRNRVVYGEWDDALAGWRVVSTASDTQPNEPPTTHAAQLNHVLTGFLYALVIALVMLACAAWVWLMAWLPLGG